MVSTQTTTGPVRSVMYRMNFVCCATNHSQGSVNSPHSFCPFIRANMSLAYRCLGQAPQAAPEGQATVTLLPGRRAVDISAFSCAHRRKTATGFPFPTRTKSHRTDAHRLGTCLVFWKTCLDKAPSVCRRVSGKVPALAASQGTTTGYRVSLRVEFAGWESSVPRCWKRSVSLASFLISS